MEEEGKTNQELNELVILKNNDIFTNSLVIAKGTGNEHKSVVSLIKKYKHKFEKFGNFRFSDLKSINQEQLNLVLLMAKAFKMENEYLQN